MIYDIASSQINYLQAINPRKKKKAVSLPTTEDINFDEKVNHLTWSPSMNLIAIAAGNYIYLYHPTKG
jgi:hypothetical protein